MEFLKSNAHRIYWVTFSIIALYLFYFIFSFYARSMIQLQREQCNHAAYMIYKGYDDQPEDVAFRDWLTRTRECAEAGQL